MTDLYRELRCAESIARLAGQHILQERDRQLEVSLKGPDDVVTNVDRSTEKLIVDKLQSAFPGDSVLGEEFGASDARQENDSDSTRTWIIDPIDGTLNFSQGIPLFCVSIGFQINDRIEVAAIYDPCRDELFSALRGDGAHLNGQVMRVSDGDRLQDSVLVTGFPLEASESFEWTMLQFNAMTRTCRGIRRLGSAAIDLAYVACGRLEGFWEYGLNPWDTAAGILLVEEAGGKVTDLDGEAFHIRSPDLLASNHRIHQQALHSLRAAIE